MTHEIDVETRRAVDPSACAAEPIHAPGSIQPHGYLLALDGEGRVAQASVNVSDLAGSLEAALGRPVWSVLGLDADLLPRDLLADAGLEGNPHDLGILSIPTRAGRRRQRLIVHRSRGVPIVELEDASSDPGPSLRDLHPLVRSFLSQIERGAVDPLEIARLAAVEVRRITGFDRVLVYRFDRDGHGSVIAEDRNGRLPSYLGLRFPASDVPAQARELYVRNRLRLIADAAYEPVPIRPERDPRSGQPLDLSHSVLRSVSPVHVEYMRNMRTPASMSISIVCEGELWGLISCHHAEPRLVGYEVRTACELLGRLLSVQIDARAHAQAVEQRIRLKAARDRVLTALASQPDLASGIALAERDLLDCAGARGAALVEGDAVRTFGEAPAAEDVAALSRWFAERRGGEWIATDSLVEELPEAEALRERAVGVLGISLSRLHRCHLFWFRPEVVRTVVWGGDPRKPAAEHAGRLHPRASFEAWRETVGGRCEPWSSAEVEAARELRNAVLGLVLRRAEELADLSAELQRANRELEAFSYSVSHDLRAPFRHIVGYAELLRESYRDALDERGRRWTDTIIESARHAGTLVDNLLSFSQMGRASLTLVPLAMDQLVAEVIAECEREEPGRRLEWTVRPLPVVRADPMMMRLVVRNLLSNAVKYTRPRDVAHVEVACETAGREHVFSVRDDGVGFDMEYADKLFGVFQRLHRMEEFEGTGIGLANVRRIVARHGGRTWAEGAVGRGATLWFTLPAAEETTS